MIINVKSCVNSSGSSRIVQRKSAPPRRNESDCDNDQDHNCNQRNNCRFLISVHRLTSHHKLFLQIIPHHAIPVKRKSSKAMSPNEKSREQEFYEYLGYVFSNAVHVSSPISHPGSASGGSGRPGRHIFRTITMKAPLADSTTILTTRGLKFI